MLESNVLIGIDGSMQNSYWHYEASLFKCQDVTNTNGSAHLPANKNNIINPTPSPPVNVTNTNGCTHLQSANKNNFVDSTQSFPVATTKESSDPNQYSDAIRLMGKLVGDNWDSVRYIFWYNSLLRSPSPIPKIYMPIDFSALTDYISAKISFWSRSVRAPGRFKLLPEFFPPKMWCINHNCHTP